MQEARSLLVGDIVAPKDRRMAQWAHDLIHAVRTGQFPYPGPLREQPRKVQAWFRAIQTVSLIVERVRGAGLGLAGGGGLEAPKVPTSQRRIIGPPQRREE